METNSGAQLQRFPLATCSSRRSCKDRFQTHVCSDKRINPRTRSKTVPLLSTTRLKQSRILARGVCINNTCLHVACARLGPRDRSLVHCSERLAEYSEFRVTISTLIPLILNFSSGQGLYLSFCYVFFQFQ